jgi:ketosteroid isomerase-like protein
MLPSGCATHKDYEPKSKDEAEIKKVLVTFDEAVRKKDVQRVALLLHENFKGVIGKQRQSVTKKEYLEHLLKQGAESHFAGAPQMNISGDKADVKIPVSVGTQWYGTIIFHLTKEDHKWLINGWEF